MIASSKIIGRHAAAGSKLHHSDAWLAALRSETQPENVNRNWSEAIVGAIEYGSLLKVARAAGLCYHEVARWQQGSRGAYFTKAARLAAVARISLDDAFRIDPIRCFASIQQAVGTIISDYAPSIVAAQIGIDRSSLYRGYSDCRLVTAVKLAKFFSFSLDGLDCVRALRERHLGRRR